MWCSLYNVLYSSYIRDSTTIFIFYRLVAHHNSESAVTIDAHAQRSLPEARPLTGASPRAAALIGCATPNTHRFVTPLVTRAHLPLYSLRYKATCKQNIVPLLAALYIVFNLFIATWTSDLSLHNIRCWHHSVFCLLLSLYLIRLLSYIENIKIDI